MGSREGSSGLYVNPEDEQEDGHSKIDYMLREDIDVDIEASPEEEDKVRDFKEPSDEGGGSRDHPSKKDEEGRKGSKSVQQSQETADTTMDSKKQKMRVKRRVKRGFLSKERDPSMTIKQYSKSESCQKITQEAQEKKEKRAAKKAAEKESKAKSKAKSDAKSEKDGKSSRRKSKSSAGS